MSFEECVNNYLKYRLQIDNTYTYEEAEAYIIKKLHEKTEKKIFKFNKNIEYTFDANNMPKLIHFTVKDKNNIDNHIWRECLNEYIKMYPDYKILVYDNDDIYNIIKYFDKKNLQLIMSIKKGALLADIFRYLILYLRGGYYSDMDCFPVKRIDKLNEIQYHGDCYNNLYIYPISSKLSNSECDFYKNPCNNCKLKSANYKKLTYNCSGHRYINADTNIIVGYEFEKTWHSKLIHSNEKNLWTDNNIGICQWFIGSKPREKLFIECYKKSVKNVSKIDFNDKTNYHFNVINSTGPLFFTKVINKYLVKNIDFKNKITILPCDYFCCGSYDKVPSTKNKFIQHKFTGSWLK